MTHGNNGRGKQNRNSSATMTHLSYRSTRCSGWWSHARLGAHARPHQRPGPHRPPPAPATLSLHPSPPCAPRLQQAGLTPCLESASAPSAPLPHPPTSHFGSTVHHTATARPPPAPQPRRALTHPGRRRARGGRRVRVSVVTMIPGSWLKRKETWADRKASLSLRH